LSRAKPRRARSRSKEDQHPSVPPPRTLRQTRELPIIFSGPHVIAHHSPTRATPE
jgi:hypothetical protein